MEKNNTEFGLKEYELDIIIDCISKFTEVESALIFGSRAKGNYKLSSDIDIAIFGEKINFDIVSDIHYFLNEVSDLLYSVDVINFESLREDALKDHINRIGKKIYTRHIDESSYK
ncbi:MAG: nucleotidyltransferase domain-containing protein [Acidaminobacteraceae bacterium]